MRRLLIAIAVILTASCHRTARESYLFLWAGDKDETASDFLAVIDATPGSAQYGAILTSIPTGESAHPHHTEDVMPAGGHLLANGFHTGRTWLFDLTKPLDPKILATFGDVAGFSHPHSFVRLADGHVLSTFQYRADPEHPVDGAPHQAMADTAARVTGGLVEMDERGVPLRAGSARDTTMHTEYIYPYSVLPLPVYDLAVSTTTDMNSENVKATSEWLQFWRLSDLTLLRSIALPPGPRGDEQQFSGEPRLLADGRSIYIHTFNCGLYLLQDAESTHPKATFVWGFQGKNCGVPVRAGHFWLQTVPEAHGIVVLDIADAEHPREVSHLTVGDDEEPHWLAIDRTGRRLVMNSAGGGTGNRLFVLDFDPSSGALSLDARFRDPGATRPGIVLTGRKWPHGFSGTPVPHGTVFSR